MVWSPALPKSLAKALRVPPATKDRSSKNLSRGLKGEDDKIKCLGALPVPIRDST